MTFGKKDSLGSDRWVSDFQIELDKIFGDEFIFKPSDSIEKTILFLTKGEAELPESLREIIDFDRSKQTLRVRDVIFKVQISSIRPTLWPKGNRAVTITLDSINTSALIRGVVTLDDLAEFEDNLFEIVSTARILASKQESNWRSGSDLEYKTITPEIIYDLDKKESDSEEVEEE